MVDSERKDKRMIAEPKGCACGEQASEEELLARLRPAWEQVRAASSPSPLKRR